MKLAMLKHTLWYENDQGDVWLPPKNSLCDDRPEEYHYMHVQNPCELTHTIYNSGGVLAKSNATYASDLVLAMVRPSWIEILRAIFRFGYSAKRLSFEEAVLRAANFCERCMNAEAYRRGLTWGYRRGSAEWYESNTLCGACMED